MTSLRVCLLALLAAPAFAEDPAPDAGKPLSTKKAAEATCHGEPCGTLNFLGNGSESVGHNLLAIDGGDAAALLGSGSLDDGKMGRGDQAARTPRNCSKDQKGACEKGKASKTR
jgi:hypothetical protein